jgi:hypothetical protein
MDKTLPEQIESLKLNLANLQLEYIDKSTKACNYEDRTVLHNITLLKEALIVLTSEDQARINDEIINKLKSISSRVDDLIISNKNSFDDVISKIKELGK